MKVYLNAEGEILQTVPSAIPRGTTVADFEVEAPIAALAITVRFSLRAGVTDPLLLPRISSVSSPGLNVWSAKLPYAVTEYAGTIAYQIEVQDANGYIIASPRGTLTITPGIAPVLPDNPPIDAWRSMMDYLQRIYDSVAANSGDTAKLEEAIAAINQWITDLQTTHAIADGDQTYEMVESYMVSKLQELVERKTITHNGSAYRLVESLTLAVLELWADILASESLLAGGSLQRDDLVQIAGGKHLRFTSDEEMEPLNDMLDDYQNGEIGGGDDVYILSKGETLADAPTNADVVIDPYGEATPAVVSINGIKPDASGNINLPIYNGEVEAV